MGSVRRCWTWHPTKHSNHWSQTSSGPRLATPPLVPSLDLPTWRLSQTQRSVQKVQGSVDGGPSQTLYGSLVAGTQQALTRVPGLWAPNKGRADGKTSSGIPRSDANPKMHFLLPRKGCFSCSFLPCSFLLWGPSLGATGLPLSRTHAPSIRPSYWLCVQPIWVGPPPHVRATTQHHPRVTTMASRFPGLIPCCPLWSHGGARTIL